MKKVMIYAYTHFNLGDDLFISMLCERYPETKFVLYAPQAYKHSFKNINNIRFFPSDSMIIRVFNYMCRKLHIYNPIQRLLAKTCDMAVHIGGSLFIQKRNWKEDLAFIKTLKIKGKPFFLLGANFGPFHDPAFYSKYKEIFSTYTDICFREKHSYDLFKDLNNVRMADDIIFGLKRHQTLQEDKTVVISVIKPSIRKHLSHHDEIYYLKIKEIAIYFIEGGYNVTLMSFCEYEKDHEAIEMITKLIPKNYLYRLTKHSYTFNIEASLRVIAHSSLVVATRFHAMILGWVYGKPVYPIAYSDKMIHVMRDVGFNGSYIDFDNLNELEANHIFESIKMNSIDISQHIKNAEKHFNVLDEYLFVKEKG